MNKQEFIEFIETKSKYNLKKDSYGNYKGQKKDGTIVKYLIHKNSVRLIYQYTYEDFEGNTKKGWNKEWSNYYSNLEINPETGGLRKIKKVK